MRILIIQTAFLGDVVLATALVKSLADAYPEAELHMLVRKGNEGLLENHPLLRQLWVWDKAKKEADWLRLLGQVRQQKFDAVVCVQRFAAMGLITALSGAKIKSGFSKNPFSFLFTHKAIHELPSQEGIHEVARNQALLAPFPLAKAARPYLVPTQEAKQEAAPYQTGQYLSLAPASVWETKQLHAKTWANLLQLLSIEKPDQALYLIGGPSDKPLIESIIDRAGVGINLAGKLSLAGSTALLAGATRLYANDSGPVHLASAVGCPTTAIFCSTVPAFGFGPLAPGSAIVQESIGLPCRPCGLHGKRACPEGHFLCGKVISAEAILAVEREG